jgi:hypothetical protein
LVRVLLSRRAPVASGRAPYISQSVLRSDVSGLLRDADVWQDGVMQILGTPGENSFSV